MLTPEERHLRRLELLSAQHAGYVAGILHTIATLSTLAGLVGWLVAR